MQEGDHQSAGCAGSAAPARAIPRLVECWINATVVTGRYLTVGKSARYGRSLWLEYCVALAWVLSAS